MGQAHGPLHLGCGGLHLRAQDRRPGHEPAVRGRPADPGRDPRGRRGRRGRHRQRDHDSAIPRQLPAAGLRMSSRFGARSTCRSRPSRISTAARRRPAPARSSIPATPPPARCGRRIRGSRPAGSWASGPTSWARSRAAPTSPRTCRAWTGCVRSDSRSTPTSSWSTAWRRSTTTAAGGWTAPHPRLRDRRDRHQGRRPGPAPGARRHLQGTAVGDRLQVPAGGEDHVTQGHHGVDRADRQGHPVRHARARRGGRSQGVAGDAAQRGPGPHQGRPPGRHRRGTPGG